MKVLLVFSVLITWACASSVNEGNGKGLGIINGQAVGHSIPSQVFLVILNNLGYRWCGGTLITQNYVLTSAYCIYQAKSMEARLGVNNRSATENTAVTIQAKSWLWHEKFAKNELDTLFYYDVGLVLLERPATLTNYIQTIKLSLHAPKVGAIAGVSGWGLDTYWGKSAEVLMQASVRVMDNDVCKNTFGFIQPFMVCTNGTNGGGYCNGDQGGPLILDGQQVGIVSFGNKFCEYYTPTYYTRVQYFVTWIKNHSDYQG